VTPSSANGTTPTNNPLSQDCIKYALSRVRFTGLGGTMQVGGGLYHLTVVQGSNINFPLRRIQHDNITVGEELLMVNPNLVYPMNLTARETAHLQGRRNIAWIRAWKEWLDSPYRLGNPEGFSWITPPQAPNQQDFYF
jgi:hypothetical protein